MDSVIIPSSPNWYEPDIMACAPDNTLMYGSRNDLVVIKPTEPDKPDEVHIIPDAHYKWITSISFNRNWGSPNKYAVTVSDDKVIKLWDVETLQRKMSHNNHALLDESSKVIGVSFAGDNRIVSASADGVVIIWNLVTNERTVLDTMFKSVKGTLTCLLVCPHEASRAAFGLKNGLVIVADLRRAGKILATYRGHKAEVLSLAWCPAPVNVFPKKPNNTVGEKKLELFHEVENISVSETSNVNDADERATIETNSSHTNLSGKPFVSAENTDHVYCKIHKSIETMIEPVESNEQITNCGEQEKDQYTPTDRNPIPMELSGSTKGESKIIMRNIENNEINPDTPTDRRNVSMELSTSLANVPKNEEETDSIASTDRFNLSTQPEASSQSDEQIKIYPNTGSRESLAFTERKESELLELKESNSNTNFVEVESMVSEMSKQLNNDLKLAENGTENLPVEKTRLESCPTSFEQSAMNSEKSAEQVEPSQTENWRAKAPLPRIQEEPRKEYLLASSARDGYVYIWRTLGGPMETFFTVPQNKTNLNQAKSYYKGKPVSKEIYVVVCWVTPNMLLTSSSNGDVLGWTLPKPPSSNKLYRRINNEHGKLITSVKAPVVYSDETNFLQKRNVTLWTSGLGRVLCNFDCDSKKIISYYQSLNGPACFLAGCPLDPTRLAIGDEKNIKIWNLGQTSKKTYKFPTSFENIHAVISAMVWHPTNENIIAWGTVEGRIGLLTLSGNKWKTKILPQFFKTEIHKLEWGPETSGKKPKLFAISEGVVVIFDIDSKDDPQPLILPSREPGRVNITTLYTFSWKPDYTCLLLTSKSGACIKFNRDLTSSDLFYVEQRIDCIVWHPDAIALGGASKYSKMFASVVMGTGVKLYEFVRPDENEVLTPLTYVSNRNKSRIRAIQWSPLDVQNLVWVDDAGIAQIVNIMSGNILYTYINPWLDALVSVYWSPVDLDYIILGTDKRRILTVKFTDHPALTDNEIDIVVNRIRRARENELNNHVLKPKDGVPKVKESTKNKNQKKSPFVPVFYTIKDTSQVVDLEKVLQWKLERPNVEYSSGNDNRIGVLDVFGDDKNLEKVFDANIKSFLQNGNTKKTHMLALFQGNINEVIKEAIHQKRVDSWIISVAAMVSPQCWKQACETYVHQLLQEQDPDPFEVVTFQLACHQVEEAVKFLCDKKLFREAYVLAKCRFGSDTEIVAETLNQWAKNSYFEGNYELAACCHISLGKYDDAALLLLRRAKVELLEFAVKLTTLSGNVTLQETINNKLEALRKPIDTQKLLSKLDNNDELLRIINHSDVERTTNVTEDDNVQEMKLPVENNQCQSSVPDPDCSNNEVTHGEGLVIEDIQAEVFVSGESSGDESPEPESFASAVDDETEDVDSILYLHVSEGMKEEVAITEVVSETRTATKQDFKLPFETRNVSQVDKESEVHTETEEV